MWKYEKDSSDCVITAEKHIESCHSSSALKELPKTAVLFYMRGGEEYTSKNYDTEKLSDKFPRFLNACPVYRFCNHDVCFLDGGRGAPQAADTIETLGALGVENVVAVGMFGAFSDDIEHGSIIVPSKAFVEEGTSLHYYSEIDYSQPDSELCNAAVKAVKGSKSLPIVSTDAVYRQTFFKEEMWRKQGAVGVDMETSALFSVGKYLNMKVVTILIASDKHPLSENGKVWKWSMSMETRFSFFEKCIDFSLQTVSSTSEKRVKND